MVAGGNCLRTTLLQTENKSVARELSLTVNPTAFTPASSKRKNYSHRRAFRCPSLRKWMRDEPPNAGSLIQSRSHRREEFRGRSRASHLPTLRVFLRRVRGVCPGGLFSNWKDLLADTLTRVACLRLAACWPL